MTRCRIQKFHLHKMITWIVIVKICICLNFWLFICLIFWYSKLDFWIVLLSFCLLKCLAFRMILFTILIHVLDLFVHFVISFKLHFCLSLTHMMVHYGWYIYQKESSMTNRLMKPFHTYHYSYISHSIT